jgi:hypothetical protein
MLRRILEARTVIALAIRVRDDVRFDIVVQPVVQPRIQADFDGVVLAVGVPQHCRTWWQKSPLTSSSRQSAAANLPAGQRTNWSADGYMHADVLRCQRRRESSRLYRGRAAES